MIGLDILHIGAGLLMLAGGTPSGHVACPDMPLPKVEVNVTVKAAPVDASRTSDELSGLMGGNSKGISPGETVGEQSSPLGMHWSTYAMKPEIVITGSTHRKRGFLCLWYDRVKIDITLTSQTYVARAGWSPGCRAGIEGHERMHAEVNRQFAEQLRRELAHSIEYALKRAHVFGPYYPSQREEITDRMHMYLGGVIASHNALMQTVLDERQRAVDNMRDAIRITIACRSQG
jgi:hypothetical protein